MGSLFFLRGRQLTVIKLISVYEQSLVNDARNIKIFSRYEKCAKYY